MSLLTLIIVCTVCILLEGFFSGSEMALVNSDKYKLALATDSGSKRALAALHLIKHPGLFFSTTLLGTNMCTVMGSVVVTIFIIDHYGAAYAPFAILYWPFTLILGELVPKSVCQFYSDRLALRVSPILFVVSIVLYPAVWLLSKLTNALLGGVRDKGANRGISREDLEIIIKTDHPDGSDVKQTERTLVSRIFDLAEKRVKNIMTPLVDVVELPITATREDAANALDKHGFSRIPVFDGRVFNIVGVLSGTDILFGNENSPVAALMRQAYFVPEEMSLDELLVAMKRKGEAMAIAVNEYGAATGLVTTEDLLEEVVGEIHDEYDEAISSYKRLGWRHYLISGRMEVEKANDRLKLEIPTGAFETVAGFVVHKFERIPREGDTFRHGRLRFIVKRATDRAVLEVEVVHVLDGDRKASGVE